MKTVYAASGASLAIGLFFIFVWAPHPWGWQGFDQYHELALEVAAGQPYATLEKPWGYAYFAAFWYTLFGDRPWIVLVVQAILNASTPLLVYWLAAQWFDRRIAITAAVLTGLFSFNTVYASTQSSDAMCTWIFMLAVAAFTAALRDRQLRWFAATGLLAGIAPQFRPNLILLPLVLAAMAVVGRAPLRRRVAHATVLAGCAGLALLPWTVRNYRLTHELLPTSVHGAVQLWYGSLQVGPYRDSFAYNPRAVFEAPAFEYTSLPHEPLTVEGRVWCGDEKPTSVTLFYSTDVDRADRELAPTDSDDSGHYRFVIPPPHRNVVLYYYFRTEWASELRGPATFTPLAGPQAPSVYFVTTDHLGDLDVHGDLLDIFDVVRLARRAAWDDPLPFASALRDAGISDARDAVTTLLTPLLGKHAATSCSRIDATADEIRVGFSDGSSLTIPRRWTGSITDLTISRGFAATVMVSRASLAGIRDARTRRPLPPVVGCTLVHEVAVNDAFYRREPHLMRRYASLAIDNIGRAPGAFVLASAYRALRLFVIVGNDDQLTTQQFAQSRRVYRAATAASCVLLAMFLAGVVIAWRRRYPVALPLLLIAYLPATLAPVLTNMRYTLTVQPLMFMFVAVALGALRPPKPVPQSDGGTTGSPASAAAVQIQPRRQ